MPKVYNRAVKLLGQKMTINSIVVYVLEYNGSSLVTRAYGVTVPTGAGYAKGCLFVKTDAADGVKGVYENQGTTAVASFAPVGDAGVAFANDEAIVDSSGNELIQFGVTASAVNQLKVINSATGNAIQMAAAGGDTDIDIQLTPKGAGSVKIPAASGVKSSVSNLLVPFMPSVVQAALSGAGAIGITTYYTAVTSTGTNALTLADSTVKGQLKKVQLIVDGGDATLTFNTNATIVFADAGDFAILMWNGSDWLPVELGNDADGATAPVYTAAS